MDFSVHSDLKQISECCWSVKHGTHMIDDIIVEYINHIHLNLLRQTPTQNSNQRE